MAGISYRAMNHPSIRFWMPLATALIVLLAAATINGERTKKTRIAVIGGGISGSFVTKYLTDYDRDCSLDITVFDPPKGNRHQGSRVSSHTLMDGSVVERGASIFFGGNQLVNEMIEGSGKGGERLLKIQPHQAHSGSSALPEGLGIYDGSGFPLWITNSTTAKETLMWRYNLDLYRIHRATEAALESFGKIYDLLDDHEHMDAFFASPNDLWERVGLSHLASVSFEDYLTKIGVSTSMAWWRRWFLEPYFAKQGLVRDELYTALNICNNNQLNAQMTGLGGLVNAAAGTGNLFAIQGGNDKLIASAFAQANYTREQRCSGTSIKKKPLVVQTLVSSDFENKIELFGADGTLVDQQPYDIVVVATPLQFSGIEFMGKGSVFDEGLLYYLPLNEMVDSENSDANSHEHIHSLGGDHHLPSSALRQYTQVVTTFVSNAKLQASFFQWRNEEHPEEPFPRAILFTEEGRETTGISSIGQVGQNIYKVFSSEKLSPATVVDLFGTEALVEDVTVWGDRFGGATPAFAGGREASVATNFLLYNGGRHEADTPSTAIYYTNAIESAVSAVEIAAIGSKSVAKLLALRLGLIEAPRDQHTNGDEL